jgi:hypothetical protein
VGRAELIGGGPNSLAKRSAYFEDRRLKPLPQGILEEKLGGRRITAGGQQEINRRASGIHGTLQLSPLTIHPNVSLIHLPGFLVAGDNAYSVRVHWTDREQNRRYHPTAQVTTAGSKWRHLNKGGRNVRTSPQQGRVCNTTESTPQPQGEIGV